MAVFRGVEVILQILLAVIEVLYDFFTTSRFALENRQTRFNNR